MSTTPPAKPPQDTDSAPLNPALKQAHDDTYGRDQSGTDPMDSVSVQKEEGTAWPMIWAVTTIVCVIIAVMLLIF